jgi:hypothetical protein
MLVGLGVMVGSRVAGRWYDNQQSEIEDELRTQLHLLRQSQLAQVTVLLVDAVGRPTGPGGPDRK